MKTPCGKCQPTSAAIHGKETRTVTVATAIRNESPLRAGAKLAPARRAAYTVRTNARSTPSAGTAFTGFASRSSWSITPGNARTAQRAIAGAPTSHARRCAFLLQRCPQGRNHVRLVVLVEARVERERERARGERLGDGAEARGEAVALTHVRLQVDTWEIARGLDPAGLELGDDSLPFFPCRQRHDVDEPGARVVGVVGAGELDTRHVREKRPIAGSGGAAALEDLRELLKLGEADRCAHVVEPVVEAETSVLEPAAGIGASLVAEAAEELPLLLGVGGDHPPLTGRHLLVRVEGEDGRRAVRAHERATVDRAERLAGVLDQRQA